jgi:hypothetical protein
MIKDFHYQTTNIKILINKPIFLLYGTVSGTGEADPSSVDAQER